MQKGHHLPVHGRSEREMAFSSPAVARRRRTALFSTAVMVATAIVCVVWLAPVHRYSDQDRFIGDEHSGIEDVVSRDAKYMETTPRVGIEDYLRIDGDDGVNSGGGISQVSSHGRRKVVGFVGIQTGFGSLDRRQAIRKTWLPSSRENLRRLENTLGLVVRFVLGTTNDEGQEREVNKEIEEYGDFLRLGVHDTYASLNQKTLAYLKEAYKHYDAEYFVKVDDDVYLRLDRLSLLLVKERKSDRTYIGCMKKGPVITDRKFKWFEPDAYMLGREYFLHAWGPMYILSGEVVANIIEMRNGSLRMLANEDVTVGLWMLSMDVTYEDERRLCHSECASDSIAIWDMPTCAGLCNPAKAMVEVHEKEACSKSPTIPTERTLFRFQRRRKAMPG